MSSACISFFCMRLGAPVAILDIHKEAACTPSYRSSSCLSTLSWSVTDRKYSHLGSRRNLRHSASAFNPSEHKPFTVEELEEKIAEGNYKPFSDIGSEPGSSDHNPPSKGQASEYKPFSVDELEQKVIPRNIHKNRRQANKAVSTTFQPLGPDYPPITLEELEADLAKSNYKPFSSFEDKGDLIRSKPPVSDYKPFTVEELEQKISESSKPLSESKPFTVEELEQKISESSKPLSESKANTSLASEASRGNDDRSYGSILGHRSKPNSSEVKANSREGMDQATEYSTYNSKSVEGIDQASSSTTSTSSGNVEESDAASFEPSMSSSSEETDNSIDPNLPKKPLLKITGLYVGNLPYDYTSQHLDELFKEHGSVFVSEVIFDKTTGQSRGFGFVYMSSPEDAEVALRNLDAKEVDGRQLRVRYQETPEQKYARLSKAGANSYGEDTRNVNKLFVANLPWNINDVTLGEIFGEHGTVLEAKIVYDRDTGRSKGYGFVTLSSADEVNGALAALNGYFYEGRSLRVALAGERPAPRSSIS